MDPFTVVPIFIGVANAVVIVAFAAVFGLLIFRANRAYAEWSNNNSLPVLTVPARVLAKRAEISGNVSTFHYCTFELNSGERMEFPLSGQGYGLLMVGDVGELTCQGTRYRGFRRQVGA